MVAAPLTPLAVFADRRSGSSCRDRYLCGGITRLVGAGTPLYTRPARSNFDWWHGQKKPPSQSGPRSAGATSGRNVGEQPRCVQMPTAIEHVVLDRAVLVLAVRRLLRDVRNSGSASRASSLGSASSIACVRLMTQHDLAAPFDVDLLARLELADVDSRPARRRPSRARSARTTSRTASPPRRADAADDARRADQEPALALVYR